MIKIGLCDDISVQLSIVGDIVGKYCDEHNIDVKIKEFESGEDLLEYVDRNGFFDIYILDMILPGIRGIEIGQSLRNKGDRGKIVYLTATSEFAVESYEVDAFFYLLKPISRESLYRVLDKTIDAIDDEKNAEYSSEEKTFEVKTHDGKKVVKTRDILYVDIVNRGLAFHMCDGTILEGPMLRIPFSEAVKQLTQCVKFTFAGQHLLINIANVEKADRTSVTFVNDEVLYLSKTAGNALCEKLLMNDKNLHA